MSASHSADFGDNKNRCIVNIGPSKNHIFASFIIYKISKNQFFFNSELLTENYASSRSVPKEAVMHVTAQSPIH